MKKLSCLLSAISYKHLEPLFAELERRNLAYAVVKGEVLSILCYCEEGKRNPHDVDLLIEKKNVHIVESILASIGFVTVSQQRAKRIAMLSLTHQTSPWIKKIGSIGIIELDINFDFFWGQYEGARIDISAILSNFMHVNVFGIKIRTLSYLYSFVHLVLHHFKDLNSIYLLVTKNSYRYELFQDVYAFFSKQKHNLPINELMLICQSMNICPYMYYILYYTNYLFCDAELQQYVESFYSEEGAALLEQYGLTEKERRPWKCSFETRLAAKNIYDLIKEDLTVDDLQVIIKNNELLST